VVAVTAHVDEQRYLDLGFDAFLSKPYRLHQLARVLQACMKLAGLPLPVAQEDAALTGHAKQLPSSSPTALPELPQPTPLDMIPALPWREVFDEVSIQRLLELDPAGKNHLLERVTRMLSTSVDKYLHQLEDAWRAEDLKTIKDVVHTLKSSSANVGALKLSQCCVDIEHALKDPKQTDLVTLIVKLRDSARTVQAALPLLLEGHR
jgi:HPt (histidine-containing phosphotransfer) domain-containing protein